MPNFKIEFDCEHKYGDYHIKKGMELLVTSTSSSAPSQQDITSALDSDGLWDKRISTPTWKIKILEKY